MSTLTIETNNITSLTAIYTNEILDQVVTKKNDVLRAMRRVVAIVLFAVSFVTLSSTLNLAYGKKAVRKAVTSRISKVGSRARVATHHLAAKAKHAVASGEFRLLNIYNNLKASNPEYVNQMNSSTEGKASWYGGMFHGRKTAMGTTYDMYAMTAAHRTLPLGTWVKVTNVRNGKDAIVQVTDRGPYVADRIMDLSKAAATALGYFNDGTTEIKMDVIGQGYASADEAAAALEQQLAANQGNSQITQAAIIPASFSVSTRTANVPADSSDVMSGILDAIASTVTAPVNAIADIFA